MAAFAAVNHVACAGGPSLHTWLDDLSGQTHFAEAHVTTGRFAQALPLLAGLIANQKTTPSQRIALRTLEMIALCGLSRDAELPPRWRALRGEIATQPADFQVGWGFAGTRHVVAADPRLGKGHPWLLPLIDAPGQKDRAAILGALEAIPGLPQ
jgi:hypothetical protein